VYKEGDAEDDTQESDAEEARDAETQSQLRADGLDVVEAVRWRVVYWKRLIESFAALPMTAEKKELKARAAEKKRAMDKLAKAKDDLESLSVSEEAEGFSDFSDEEDEGSVLDALGNVDDDEDEDGSDWSAASAEDGDALLAQLGALEEADGDHASSIQPSKREPPSFSRIPPRSLHAHLGLSSELSGQPSSGKPKKGKKGKSKSEDLVPEAGCPPHLVVDLEPGEMLYLPVGWFHEVTSSSSPSESLSGSGGTHIAFN
jgi:hypothetical protein